MVVARRRITGRRPTTSTTCGCALAARVPRRAVLVHPVRHRQPDPELRAAGADRHPDRRPQPARRTAGSRRRCCRSWRASRGSSTCACTRWRTSRRCSSTSIARWRAQAGFTQRDVANNLLVTLSGSGQTSPTLLAEPGDRRQLRRRDADAAVPDGFARRISAASRSTAGAGDQRPQMLESLAAIHREAGTGGGRRTTTSSR